MKRFTQTFLAAVATLTTIGLQAQEQKQNYVTVTTLHWNTANRDLDQKEWISLEKEFVDKVIKKNEFILDQKVLIHHYTADNSELLLITTYPSWEAIEKSGKRTDELTMLAWPDEKARTAFFDKQGAFYAPKHSDEIYTTMAGSKVATTKSVKPMIYYIRKSYWAAPKDGSIKEFTELRNKFLAAATNKNDLIKAYYPLVHAWGADNTEFIETFVLENLGDVEKANEKNRDLMKAAMPDEAKRKEFRIAFDKYFNGAHGDYIYKSVPELSK